MEPDERIGVVPVATRTVAPVHHHDVDVGIGDQRVGERHPRRAGPDHQVVRVNDVHEPPRYRAVRAAAGSIDDPSPSASADSGRNVAREHP